MSLLGPQLEAFMAVTQQKTVHGAADVLHITQTAVTQRIRTLETLLSTTLFRRSRRGMALTPEGEALLHYCQAARELEGAALAKIQGAAKESTIQVRISGPTSLMRSRIIPACLPVMREFPHLLMHFDVTDEENQHKALRAGECEFAIIVPKDVAREMETKPLSPEQYVLVCSAKWAKRTLREIIPAERIIDFNPQDTMTFQYLKQYNLLDLAKPERHFVNRPESLAVMIAAGHGYGVLTQEFSQPYVDRGNLIILNDGKIFEEQLVLAWYPRHEPPQYFSALIDAIS